MSLTFRKIEGTNHKRADGADVSYVISRMPKGWLLTVYSQNVVEFKSNGTKMTLLKDPIISSTDDLLRDSTAIANAFETSEFTKPFDDRRRMRDAVERAYRSLGYTR